MKVIGKHFAPPATEEQLGKLRQALPPETPADYFEFLAASNGGEIWYDEDSPEWVDCLCFLSVEEIFRYRPTHEELMPTLLVIGGDQGSQFLAYDKSSAAPWPIIMFLPGWGAEAIAPTFTALRQRFLRDIGDTIPAKAEHGAGEERSSADAPERPSA